MLITAHDEPIVGSDRIRADLTRVHDATQYIHDETVGGMNAGKDLWTLMSEIALGPISSPYRRATAPSRGMCAPSGRSTPVGSDSSRLRNSTQSRNGQSGASSLNSPRADRVPSGRAKARVKAGQPLGGAPLTTSR